MIIVTVARRPLAESNVATNVLKHGTGALNIEATRVAHNAAEKTDDPTRVQRQGTKGDGMVGAGGMVGSVIATPKPSGRWPANLVLEHLVGCVPADCVTGCPVADLDEQSGESASSTGTVKYKRADTSGWKERGGSSTSGREWEAEGYGDAGGASRFFKQIGGRKE